MKHAYRRIAAIFAAALASDIGAAEPEVYESDESIRHRLGVSHHGGPILDCAPPAFFDEAPARDSHVQSFREFSFAASENTEADTVRVWVNNQITPYTATVERSGRLAIKGSLAAPITEGRVWVKVTGYSHDGCDQLHVWNVYVNR